MGLVGSIKCALYLLWSIFVDISSLNSGLFVNSESISINIFSSEFILISANLQHVHIIALDERHEHGVYIL